MILTSARRALPGRVEMIDTLRAQSKRLLIAQSQDAAWESRGHRVEVPNRLYTPV